MNILKKLVVALCMLATPAGATSFSDFSWLWIHPATLYDISWDAVMGTTSDYTTWATPFRAMMAAKVAAVPISAGSAMTTGPVVVKTGYTLKAFSVPFPSGPTINLFVAVPDVIDPDKPLIVSLSGHESAWGEAPNSIFATGAYGEKWAQAGYIVYAPANMFYNQLGIMSNGVAGWHDSHAVNVKMQQRLWEKVEPTLPAYTGRWIIGLSAGCETGAWWSAIEPDLFKGAVFAGHMVNLDWLRENQKAKSTASYAINGNFPPSWSIYGVMSFTSLFALLVPDPLEMQFGRGDGLFPHLTKAGPAPNYPGEPRPPIVDDVLSLHFSLKQIWSTAGVDYTLDLHNGIHEFVFPDALAFVQAH